MYPFTSEIYPTFLRTTGIGFANFFCRLGGALMPWFSMLFFVFGNTGPFLVFGITSLVSAYAAFNIPLDTRHMNLDTYIELVE